MEFEEPSHNTVDPEVRAYVYSLVSALGGTGADEDGCYVLGDDALACLKDLKKWLKLHDEKANRLDVARCLAEANLVKGDLLEILAAWPEAATEDKIKSKIALACLELLVPLTWPIEKNDTQMTVNHHRHVPYLQLAQTSYKRAILEHESATVLQTAVRIGLPSIALSMAERSSRDEGIIKLLMYFFRNIAMISPPQNLPNEGKEGEVSRSATIEAYHCQDVLALLLTISSNMGEDFNTQDTVIMEVLFHLLKGVDVEKLFMDKKKLKSKSGDELKSLLAQEAGMHRSYAKNAPTRHNRFGTMIWVKRDDAGKVSTVSGQDVLKDSQQTLSKMDQTKKWNKPRQRVKNEEPAYDRFDMPVPLTESASTHLRAFVEEFLDSGFNPMFNNVRRAIEREAERVLEAHQQQFFYLVSWFLEAERVRRRKKKESEKRSRDKKLEETFEADSFALIATVLNQESFILLNRFMQDRLDLKSWREVQAGMRCFTQILLIVQDMAESPLEEDQEIAENIQNRIFYEETTHDRIVAILRGYKDQGFGYLDSCTELSHVFLRILERYSRENVNLQVRSRRRARKSQKAAVKQREKSNEDNEDEASEMEDVAEAERVSRERKFDFTRFSTKFMTQACIDTFVSFAKYFTDLDTEQLKRAHRFFYRVAFKQDLSVMLFRLDIIALFNRMIKGPDGLDSGGPMFREWDELVRQLVKKMIKKLEQRPELAVELLFSKINSTTYYLEYGYEKQTASSQPRPPATLEVRGSMTIEEQIGVIVAVLYDDKLEQVDWVSRTIFSAAEERQSWESEVIARQDQSQSGPEPNSGTLADQPKTTSKAPSITVTPDTDSLRTAIFKEARLRLLMSLSGMERLAIEDEPKATWIIPSSLTSAELLHTYETIEHHRKNPVFEYGDDDPISAEELLRRKPAEKIKRAEYDDESEGDDIASDDDAENDFLYPFSGPVDRPNAHHKALDALKAKRRKRHHSNPVEIDDETLEARRRAREKADLEKARKVKSAEFIRDSDEESDEERDRAFFAREEMRRKGQREKFKEAFAAGRVKKNIEGERVNPRVKGAKASRKRKNTAGEIEYGWKRRKANSDSDDERSDDDEEMATDDGSSLPVRRATSISSAESEDEVTPLSSPPLVGLSLSSKATEDAAQPPPLADAAKVSEMALDAGDGEEDEADDIWVSTARRRGRIAVLEDSEDE
ncbi:MAG: Topoisomerase 1-associated factor 1 [Alectoria fallacina]|uniref:Topoisomerase 1-associated factor 1 n=1 Tax=Alectoria fallacina TaxID=1903189 RepID=A0A8H3F1F2_9LECA|nr:MAG: Topoisomerase 1-associated factor 1 [Alectoria fallacina]